MKRSTTFPPVGGLPAGRGRSASEQPTTRTPELGLELGVGAGLELQFEPEVAPKPSLKVRLHPTHRHLFWIAASVLADPTHLHGGAGAGAGQKRAASMAESDTEQAHLTTRNPSLEQSTDKVLQPAQQSAL